MRSQGYETAWSPPPGLGPSRITHRLLSLALVGLDLTEGFFVLVFFFSFGLRKLCKEESVSHIRPVQRIVFKKEIIFSSSSYLYSDVEASVLQGMERIWKRS